jgi:glycosyltransferase involved in cell wall biosynthesis
MVGSISRRKRQLEVIRALRESGLSIVVAGPFLGTSDERLEWEREVASSGVQWLGEVQDRATIVALHRAASCLVLFSRAECPGLAVLDSLAVGTPVVTSDHPAFEELASLHPGWVQTCSSARNLRRCVEQVLAASPVGPPPAIETWHDIAQRLEEVYDSVLMGRLESGPRELPAS